MSWTALAKIGTVIIGSLLTLVLACHMFLSHPTGHFYMNRAGHMSGGEKFSASAAVLEEVRFGPDRVLYAGDADRAWNVYMAVNNPQPRQTGVLVYP